MRFIEKITVVEISTKKFEDLQGYYDADLAEELGELQARFAKDRMDHSVRGLDNPIALRELRRDIARIKSEIRRRELSGYSEEQLAKRQKLVARRRKR